MKFFLDTEFCDRDQQNLPDLISIGLVSEEGHEFYVEFTDGWNPNHCNTFVLDVILPLLDAPGVLKLSRQECSGALIDWLVKISGGQAEVVCDFHLDMDLMQGLIGECPQISMAPITFGAIEGEVYCEHFDEYFVLHPNKTKHHALSDAHALRHAFTRTGYL